MLSVLLLEMGEVVVWKEDGGIEGCVEEVEVEEEDPVTVVVVVDLPDTSIIPCHVGTAS